MVLVLRTRVDNGDVSVSDDVGVGSLEGERSGIVAHDAAHLAAEPGRHTRLCVKFLVKGQFTHVGSYFVQLRRSENANIPMNQHFTSVKL